MLFILIADSKVKIARHINGCYFNILYGLTATSIIFYLKTFVITLPFVLVKYYLTKQLSRKVEGLSPMIPWQPLKKKVPIPDSIRLIKDNCRKISN